MKVPLLFHHLQYFTENDYAGFIKYLKSPFHNYYLKSYSDILKIIKANRLLLSGDRNKELRNIIVKKIRCSENTTLTILSRLGDLVIRYLKTVAYENKKYEVGHSFCEYLISVGYYDILGEQISFCWDLLNKEPKIDEDVYLKYYQMEYLNYKNSVLQDSKLFGDKSVIRQQQFTLNSAKDIYVYSLTKLVISFMNYTIQNIDSSYKNQAPYPVLIAPMFDILKKPEFRSYDKHQKSIILLYHHLYLMFYNLESDNHYNSYKKFFFKIRNMFNADFSKSHFNVLTNYCHLRHRLNGNDGKYNTEGMNVLRSYIGNKMYVNENSKCLSPILYRNFVINCNIPGTKDILKKFIDEETYNVHEKHRKDMLNFGNAYYFYLKKDYGTALKHMLDLKHPKFLYKYDIRNLELKIYFDKGSFVDLNSVLHNYRANINSEPLFTKNDKEKYKLLINNFRELMRIAEKYNMDHSIIGYEYFLKQIASAQGFVMKQWFIEKIKSIIQAHYLKHGTKKRKQ